AMGSSPRWVAGIAGGGGPGKRGGPAGALTWWRGGGPRGGPSLAAPLGAPAPPGAGQATAHGGGARRGGARERGGGADTEDITRTNERVKAHRAPAWRERFELSSWDNSADLTGRRPAPSHNRDEHRCSGQRHSGRRRASACRPLPTERCG